MGSVALALPLIGMEGAERSMVAGMGMVEEGGHVSMELALSTSTHREESLYVGPTGR